MARSPSITAAGRAGPSRASLLSDRALVLLREARWLLLCTLALFVALILLSYHKADPGWSHAVVSREVHNLGGRVGAWFADLLLYLFGLSAYLIAGFLLLRVVSGYRQLHRRRLAERREAMDAPPFGWDRWVGFALLFAGCVSIEASRLAGLGVELPLAPGGLAGRLLAEPLLVHLGAVGGTLLMLLMVAVGFSLATGLSWLTIFERTGAVLEGAIDAVRARREARLDRRAGAAAATVRKETVEVKRKILAEDPEPVRIEPPAPPVEKSERAQRERQKPLFADLPADTELPPISLLDPPAEHRDTVPPDTLEFTSRLIEKKLSDFGVSANVVAAYPGPVITRYEIEPATGIKGSMIVNLSKDLARALSLTSIRVVETIPGKSLMGLELPNPRRQAVRLSEVLASQVFADSPSAVTLALGHDIAGRPVVTDLAKMPHLLVAGTTGSGKSVGINAMLLSLLYKADP
ncbi:MAG TPA: DNA translocase FtsK 4TM domain-containing protein, partial [Burkholderiaceae bacterium]|nr:DNA translocase FtsK 4TM domain-containing protein [Burkholderiaceae bacterium]